MNALTLIKIAQLLAFSLLLSAGQVLFKKAAMSAPAFDAPGAFLSLLGNGWLWAALALYGLGTLLWIYILQTTPLSLAYPFIALGFVVVPLASWLLFGEAPGWAYAGGVAMIVLGLGLITAVTR